MHHLAVRRHAAEKPEPTAPAVRRIGITRQRPLRRVVRVGITPPRQQGRRPGRRAPLAGQALAVQARPVTAAMAHGGIHAHCPGTTHGVT